MKGPTIRRAIAGRTRRTEKPPGSRGRAWIVSAMRLESVEVHSGSLAGSVPDMGRTLVDHVLRMDAPRELGPSLSTHRHTTPPTQNRPEPSPRPLPRV